jgi:hypothetical protein
MTGQRLVDRSGPSGSAGVDRTYKAGVAESISSGKPEKQSGGRQKQRPPEKS